MKISYNWLKKYISFEFSVADTSEILTDIGLEVESVEKYEPIKGGLKGVVVGKVISCVKHPDADKLHITKVDIGKTEPLQIVCGASNIAQNQTVLVATIGSKLYFTNGNELEIKQTKIRGIVSEGMICAEDELGIGDSHAGIMVLPDNIEIGKNASELFDTEIDHIFEIGLTPNRSDAMSHFGVARDISAAVNCRFNKNKNAILPIVDNFKPTIKNCPISIEIKDFENCIRYSGVYIENITVKESPEWIKKSLKSIGINSINNIVDVTNFVMFEIGQPLHAFDAKKIKGNKIIVRKADEMPFVTLDNIERKLNGSELMICDSEKELCMAGIYGGIGSGVTESTTSIFLESANFNSVSIRRSSKLHGLKTDSSFRYERGCDPEITFYAIKRFIDILSEQYSEIKYSEIIDEYPKPVSRPNIIIEIQNITSLIGKEIPIETIKQILISLDFEILSEDNSGFRILSPLYRTDVTREADVIEEILRIYGFNSIDIPEKISYTLSYKLNSDDQKEKLRENISNWLSSNGFYESINNSLSKTDYFEKFNFLKNSEAVKILNPLSKELETMRQSLLPGLLENVLLNQNYQQFDVRLYEFGKHYFYNPLSSNAEVTQKYQEKEFLSIVICGNENSENWKYPMVKSDFFSIKKIAEELLAYTHVQDKFNIHAFSDNQYREGVKYIFNNDQTVIQCGIIHPKILKHFDIKQDVFFMEIDWKLFSKIASKKKVKYNEINNFQSVKRDLAMLIDKEVEFAEIKKIAKQSVGKLLKDINIFDVYEGEKIPNGKKSYAVRFTFQDDEKTMNEKDINRVMDKLIKSITTQINVEIR